MKRDQDIIADCLNGKQLAYKVLYEKYVAYVYGLCVRYDVPKAELKDVVQVIFSEVFKSLPRYKTELASFKTWLTRISVNRIISHRRAYSKLVVVKSLDDASYLENQQSQDEISDNIDREHILFLVKKMPEKYRLVFNLFVIDGYTHDEIAEQLRISSGSSRVILSRARAWVQEHLINHLTA
ncbi:MAG: sigma-70 family RNA polymerase sigma factor [Bacteroidota bacterium]